MRTWPYRREFDLVAETTAAGPRADVAEHATTDSAGHSTNSSFAAGALGWLDEVNRVGLLEPVGTDPQHARRGLGAAVSLACLRALRDAGATRAVVCPRGDAAYPVPRKLYHRIGFRDAGRTVTYARNPDHKAA